MTNVRNKEDEMGDGGPAFAYGNPEQGGDSGITKRDWFATFAPEPTGEQLSRLAELDRHRNPYNEPGKPAIRTTTEIRAALRYEWADAMLAARRRPSERQRRQGG